MSRIIREQLINLILIAAVIVLVFVVWQFILRPSEDREPSRSRMVWQEYSFSQYFSTCPEKVLSYHV